MNLLVVSDTHGYITHIVEIIKSINNLDMVIHLGDHYKDALDIKKEIGDIEVEAVLGNCDGEEVGCNNKILEIENNRIFITHGHIENVRFGLTRLYFEALSKECNIALFGHTHIPLNIDNNGIKFINPGSITLPREQNEPSYALLKLEQNNISTKIVYI